MPKLVKWALLIIGCFCMSDVDAVSPQRASGCKGPPAHIRFRPRLNRQRRAEYAQYLWRKEEYFRTHPELQSPPKTFRMDTPTIEEFHQARIKK